MEITLDRILDRTAAARPGAPFLRFEGTTIRYGDFHTRVGRLAAGLARAGIGPGDAVALLLGNLPEFMEVTFALLRRGAVVVPLNHLATAPEIAALLGRARPAACVASARFTHLLPEGEGPPKGRFLVGGDEAGWVPFESLRREETGDDEGTRPAPDDPALLLFTSGTEGEPRGVFLSHRNIAANARQCVEAIGPTADDRFLLFLPLFHTFTLTVCLFLPVVVGASIVLVRSAHNFPAIMKNEVLRRRVTFFIGVPAVFNALARRKVPLLFRKLHRIRVMVSGSAPLSPETIEAVEAKLGAPLLEGYGLTEAGPVVSVNRIDGRRPGTVGPPLPGVDARVVDEEGSELPAGGVGELWVRGENVARRLLDGSSLLRDGWLPTGDLASLDDAGRITIHDRRRDLILVRGINVYPREVEEAIGAHPDVAAAAVVRAADARRGEVPRAFVVPAEGRSLSARDVTGFLRGRIAPYKIPVYVEIVSELPRTATGKVLRRVLADRPLPEGTAA